MPAKLRQFIHPQFGHLRAGFDNEWEPWLDAADVARQLNTQSRDAMLGTIDPEHKGVVEIMRLSGLERIDVINEFGFLEIAHTIDTNEFWNFHLWVVRDVLKDLESMPDDPLVVVRSDGEEQ